MSVILAPGTYLKDPHGKDLAGPGDTVTLTADEEAAMLRTGSAIPAELPPTNKET
jgi:archaellum component FlaF (FlaF/FlaG flagellin family)